MMLKLIFRALFFAASKFCLGLLLMISGMQAMLKLIFKALFFAASKFCLGLLLMISGMQAMLKLIFKALFSSVGKFCLGLLLIISGMQALLAEESKEPQTTAEKLEALKKEVLNINRDLFILEEDLLFPASTQIAVYLSVDIGQFFNLDNIKLKIDDKDVTHHLYTEKDIDALHRGAIQKLYLGNLATGKHQLVALVIGIGPNQREYRRAIALDFEKTTESKALEIQIRDDTAKQQPLLKVIEW